MKLRSSRRLYLPDDLMVDIIGRLPVEDLLRFRSVNKSWYRFIGSSSFIKSTISNTNINNHHNNYLLCKYNDYYSLTNECTDSTNGVKYYYTPQLFGIDKSAHPGYSHTPPHILKVYGVCKGLLCVSVSKMVVTSSIYLWNPVIRKTKRISMIRPARGETKVRADLCFGYFHDDYKVVRIVPFHGGKYGVGVYSLSTDTWKVIYCDGDTYAHARPHSYNKFVGGVAFFGVPSYSKSVDNYRLLGFDLNHDRIMNIEFPHEFDYTSLSMEACGESIALIQYMRRHLIKWILRYCAATNTSTWDKIATLEIGTPMRVFPLGFTKHGKYLLLHTNASSVDDQYLWDFGKSQLEACTSSDTGVKDNGAWAIDSLLGNLVLLNEKTLDPFVEMEPCSTQTTCVLYKFADRFPSLRNKKRTDVLGRRRRRKIRQTEIEKPRKKGEKEMLNNTGRRKGQTEMEKTRKKERKEMMDMTKNVFQGRGEKRRMEETETEKPRKKGWKEMIHKTHILQGWGAKRRRD